MLKGRYRGLYKSAVHLRANESTGLSRLGGLPVMPAEIEWPQWKDKPQAFLAQLDLSEIHGALASFLPASGFLYFFYDQDQSIWGFDPQDAAGWRVCYCEGDLMGIVERSAPEGLSKDSIYRPKRVAPCLIDTLPDSQSLPPADWDWDRDGDSYFQLRSAPFRGQPPHQMFGYASPVQDDDMERQCQFVSNGIYLGNAEGYKDPRIPALEAGAADWKLLLQLDSDDDTGWMWGDAGTLYFWIREQDARRCDFSKVWMIFQCA